MSEARVREEMDGNVLILTIDYPQRKNAIAPAVRAALEDAIERGHADKAVRAIVITGAEGTFCAGGDISSMDVGDALAGRERMRRTHRLVRLMARGAKPIVAAVEGWAAGAGMAVACACDTIVAAEDARFVAGFHKIGLMSDMGLPYFLPRRVSVGRARRILFYHEVVNAPEGERIGLVDYLAPPGKALEVALEKARFLAAEASGPIELTKKILSEGLDEALADEQTFQGLLFTTSDFQEGRAAFLEKRKPKFGG
ncbi:enoyl-CoA hydratase/isomerase family protein [Roseomonas terrae]|uniref:Enoyl-CoA hydratase/isomerase family protein n=1 Tax=Neoroseomonas terrae TaxID=424799 RepID=A0ABS5EFF1_9PROT|nr:enoyl-CoA hydratase-related protein [Neoroseomonas terrae]MBR0649748.1 enoyl-CoA hydratase/isomerase family protein [Neoroseomonas terrae]